MAYLAFQVQVCFSLDKNFDQLIVAGERSDVQARVSKFLWSLTCSVECTTKHPSQYLNERRFFLSTISILEACKHTQTWLELPHASSDIYITGCAATAVNHRESNPRSYTIGEPSRGLVGSEFDILGVILCFQSAGEPDCPNV